MKRLQYTYLALYLLPWIWMIAILASPISSKFPLPKGSPGFLLLLFAFIIPSLPLPIVAALRSRIPKNRRYPLRSHSKRAFWACYLGGCFLGALYGTFLAKYYSGTYRPILGIPPHLGDAIAIWSLALSPLLAWWLFLSFKLWIDEALDQNILLPALKLTLFSMPFSIVELYATYGSISLSTLVLFGTELLLLLFAHITTLWSICSLAKAYNSIYVGCLYYSSFLLYYFAWSIMNGELDHPMAVKFVAIGFGISSTGGAVLISKVIPLKKRSKQLDI